MTISIHLHWIEDSLSDSKFNQKIRKRYISAKDNILVEVLAL